MLFSVIVPIYKSEAYLEQCVESILAQTFADFEVILVDDGSPDKCPLLCDRFAAADARVKVIHKENGGAVSARIAGAEQARGEYVLTVDSDDYVDAGLLEALHKAVQTQSCDMILYNAVAFSETDTSPMCHRVPAGVYEGEQLKALHAAFMHDPQVGTLNFGNILFALWAKAVKRPLFLEYQQKAPTAVRKGDDLAAFAPMLYSCRSLVSLEECYYHYRINPTSMMHAYADRDVVSLETFYAHLLPYCEKEYRLNLERCVLSMMLEHVAGIAKSNDSYRAFYQEFKKLIGGPLAAVAKQASTAGLRGIDKLKLFSLKRKARLLYRYYR